MNATIEEISLDNVVPLGSLQVISSEPTVFTPFPGMTISLFFDKEEVAAAAGRLAEHSVLQLFTVIAYLFELSLAVAKDVIERSLVKSQAVTQLITNEVKVVSTGLAIRVKRSVVSWLEPAFLWGTVNYRIVQDRYAGFKVRMIRQEIL
jgi:hypothetical protein